MKKLTIGLAGAVVAVVALQAVQTIMLVNHHDRLDSIAHWTRLSAQDTRLVGLELCKINKQNRCPWNNW